MKYEKPELTTLTPAINAIQSGKAELPHTDSPELFDVIAAYQDWE